LKYYELLKDPSMGAQTSAPIEVVVESQDSKKIDDISENVAKIMAFMESQLGKDNNPPPGYADTILNEEQIMNVVTMLLEFQNKYFSATPLSDELERRFVWNIPLNVYKAAMTAKTKEWPDCLNPLYWFYIFCTQEPGDMLGRFMITAVNSITDEEYECLSNQADEYDRIYSENDDSISDDSVIKTDESD
jgi:hypothetical protein